MNTLLTVLGLHAGDSAQAEKLLDWIFHLNGNTPLPSAVLLVCDPDVHPEMQAKIRIAAEVAFDHVDLIVAPTTEMQMKGYKSNNLFSFAGHHVMLHYRIPWLWIEPDCVPLKKSWLEEISNSYHSQPKRFMGSHLKTIDKDHKELVVLSRVACYPVAGIIDVNPYCSGSASFNMVATKMLVDRSTKTKLIQHISYNHETDSGKIRPDAVLLHSDKNGSLIHHLRSQETIHVDSPKPELPTNGEVTIVETPVAPKRRGRPPLNRAVAIS